MLTRQTRPSRRHFIHTQYYSGEINSLLRLGESLFTDECRRMLSAHQVCASASGYYIAMCVAVDDGSLVQIVHNIPQIPDLFFQSSARLLQVRSDGLVVWGTPKNETVTGVYRIKRHSVECMAEIADLQHVQRTQTGFLCVGQRLHAHENDLYVIATEHGVFEHASVPHWMTCRQSPYVFLTEEAHESLIFTLTAEGIKDVAIHQSTLPPEALLVRVFSGGFVYALQELDRARIVRVRGRAVEHVADLFGVIDALWVSPYGKSVAWLLRRSDQDRELFLDGLSFFTGDFSCAEQVVWNEHETHLACRVRKAPANGEFFQGWVSSAGETLVVSSGYISEVLLDDVGDFEAHVLCDQDGYMAVIRGKYFTVTPFVWNLQRTKLGAIAFHSICGETVRFTIDVTDITRN